MRLTRDIAHMALDNAQHQLEAAATAGRDPRTVAEFQERINQLRERANQLTHGEERSQR